jgi:hypothetical protein
VEDKMYNKEAKQKLQVLYGRLALDLEIECMDELREALR